MKKHDCILTRNMASLNHDCPKCGGDAYWTFLISDTFSQPKLFIACSKCHFNTKLTVETKNDDLWAWYFIIRKGIKQAKRLISIN